MLGLLGLGLLGLGLLVLGLGLVLTKKTVNLKTMLHFCHGVRSSRFQSVTTLSHRIFLLVS